jgi:hypothetical protein
MGTRGAFGVRINKTDKITYNHFDSYPSGLGANIVADIRQMAEDKFDMRCAAERLEVASPKSTPTYKQIEALKPYTDLGVGEQSTQDWYSLTRKLQGELYETLKAGVLIDSSGFMHDSLFCEYAYILNLDDGTLEFYKGFQKRAHGMGRYAAKADPKEQYYGVALISSTPLQEIASMTKAKAEKFVEAMEPETEEEPA